MRRMKGKLFYLLAALFLMAAGCAEKKQEKDTVRSMIYLYPRNALEVSVQPENDGGNILFLSFLREGVEYHSQAGRNDDKSG